MQYDVKTALIHGSGLLVKARCRMKQGTIIGNGTAGQIDFFDSITAPVAATYSRTANVVTITSTAHGLGNGAKIGIAYNSLANVSPVSGNYVITVTSADTFTVTDYNSGNIANTAVCNYTNTDGNWIMGLNTLTGVQPFQLLIPGEGILCQAGIYALSNNIVSTQVTYG